MKNRMRPVAGFAALGLLLLAPFAWGQGFLVGDDPMIYAPEVFIIVDTSGSMLWGTVDNQYNTCNPAYCGAGGCATCYPCGSTAVQRCARDFVVREVLTGTYDVNSIGACNAAQAADGILDIYKEQVRFGYSTYSWAAYMYPDGGAGDSCGTCGQMGIRNRSSPTGALIDLVDPADPADILGNNARIQTSSCNTTAIYNTGTPINAALWDARWYWGNWTTETTPPYSDPAESCRDKYVILLTDGADSGYNVAYYGTPAWQALQLFLGTASGNPAGPALGYSIPVFVIGFGAGAGDANTIALAGSGGLVGAYNATDPVTLKAQLSIILDAILAGQASRTQMTSVASGSSLSEDYQFAAYFEITDTGLDWKGHLVKIPTFLDADGDLEYAPEGSWTYFEEELASTSPADRLLLTVVTDPRSQSAAELPREIDLSDETVGLYPFERGKTATDALMCLRNQETAVLPTDTDLANMIKDYVRGVSGAFSVESRVVRDGQPVLGDIFHSDPVVIPPPSALTPDYKYEAYFRCLANRPTTLYVGANDGMLHAFAAEDIDTADGDDTDKELWGFIPNNLLAKIQNVRQQHDFFVDGTPVVRDVYSGLWQAWDYDWSTDSCNGLEDADPPNGGYRTVLVSGERSGGAAYFALDVSQPKTPRYLWEYRTDRDVATDYADVQCLGSVLQSLAEPVLGEVWVKNEHTDDTHPEWRKPFLARPVAILPGGYMPPQQLLSASSCVAFAEALVGANSVHVVELDTGKLLKKFAFTTAVDSDVEDLLNLYYTKLAEDPDANWNHWGGGNDFGDLGSLGWNCGENRGAVANEPYLPPELLEHCTVEDTATLYRRECCYNPGDHDPGCHGEGLTSCHYVYEKRKDVPGGLHIFLKTDGCSLVPDDPHRGRFELNVADDFWIESVAGTSSAYNRSLGEYLSRVFVSTTRGRVYRLDFETALYNRLGDEAEKVNADNMMIKDNTDTGFPGVTMRWDVGREDRDPGNPADPWFDMERDAGHTPRPIMAPGDLAMDYSGELLYYFGTGETDTLEYKDVDDYMYVVREVMNYDDGFARAELRGTLVDSMQFPDGERMYGRPLVAGGTVFFTSYIANPDSCSTGGGGFYGRNFVDLQDEVIPTVRRPTGGTVSAPTLVWTLTGPKVMIQQASGAVQMDVGEGLDSTSRKLDWGKVL